MNARASRVARKLGLFTVLCFGINNIVGSGIYMLPGRLALELGPCSWLAFALDGLLLATVALCFAAMASRHDETGGPYVYAKEAFGPWVGFAVGWTAWVSMWAAIGGVAAAVPGYLAVFVPGADEPHVAKAIALGIVVALCALNCVGLQPAARTATLLTIAKLVPLLLFVLAGISTVRWERIRPLPDSFHGADLDALGRSLFVAFFPLQGFEVVPVPAGELARPRRDVPLAVVGALLGSAALYCLIQIVAFAHQPAIALMTSETDRPVAEAAGAFLGDFGRRMMAAGACVSFLGFASVQILCAPRFLLALGADRLLPAPLARIHPRFGTPLVAVVATCIPAAIGCFVASFEKLAAMSNVAVLVQYGATCLAVMVVAPAAGSGAWRLPGGRFALPSIGLVVCVLFGALVAMREDATLQYGMFGACLAVGLVLAAIARRAGPKSRPPLAPHSTSAPKTYSLPAAQPFVFSEQERRSLAETRAGAPNPWSDAARAVHARELARSILRRWRDEFHEPDAKLVAALARRGIRVAGANELEKLDPETLRRLSATLDATLDDLRRS